KRALAEGRYADFENAMEDAGLFKKQYEKVLTNEGVVETIPQKTASPILDSDKPAFEEGARRFLQDYKGAEGLNVNVRSIREGDLVNLRRAEEVGLDLPHKPAFIK